VEEAILTVLLALIALLLALLLALLRTRSGGGYTRFTTRCNRFTNHFTTRFTQDTEWRRLACSKLASWRGSGAARPS
jgi:cell division protein FtsL